jgi:hypothetical protein
VSLILPLNKPLAFKNRIYCFHTNTPLELEANHSAFPSEDDFRNITWVEEFLLKKFVVLDQSNLYWG